MHTYNYEYYRVEPNGALAADGSVTVQTEDEILSVRPVRNRTGADGLIVKTIPAGGAIPVYRYQGPRQATFEPNNRWTDTFVVPGRYLATNQLHDDLAMVENGVLRICSWNGSVATQVLSMNFDPPTDLEGSVVTCGWFHGDTRKDHLLFYESKSSDVCAGELRVIDSNVGTTLRYARKWRTGCKTIVPLHDDKERSRLVLYHHTIEKRTRRVATQLCRHQGPSPHMELKKPDSKGHLHPRAASPGPLREVGGKKTPCTGGDCNDPDNIDWWPSPLFVVTGSFPNDGRIVTIDTSGNYHLLRDDLLSVQSGTISPAGTASVAVVSGCHSSSSSETQILVVRSA